MAQKPDFLKLREDFPVFKKTMHGKPLVYLDTAATAQKPQVVIDCIADFYANHYGTVHRAIYELAVDATKYYQDTREKARAFLNAEKLQEIIFTRGTTESINLVASSFGKAFIQPGDEVIISEVEHHSNIVPWQMMCEERQTKLRIIPVNERGEVDLEAYANLLNSKTKMVAIAHIANSIGTIHPIKKIIEMAHAKGAKVLIDGAQSAAHMPIDVQALDADFFVFSGHKAYGPTGVGVLYGKEALLEAMPPYQGGGDMIETVTFDKTSYNTLPLKFEAGTPNIADVIGLGAALDYLNKIGMPSIALWEHELLEYATTKLLRIPGVKIIGTAEEKASIISFVVEGIHPLDIGTFLDLEGVAVRTGHHCAQPTMRRFNVPSTLRVSLSFYNDQRDIDRFTEALKRSIAKLK